MKKTIFRRIMLLIICLFIPLIASYTYSNYKSQSTLTDQIESLNMNHSLFFVSQLESRMERLKESATFLTNDDDVQQFIYYDLLEEWDSILLKQRLLEKLKYLNTNNNWNDWMALISPRSQMRIYSNFSVANAENYIEIPKATSGWQYVELSAGPMKKYFFTWNLAFPYNSQDESYAPQLIVQVGISIDTLSDMLQQFKNERRGEAFLYAPGQEPIIDGDLPAQTLELWEQTLAAEELANQGSLTMKTDSSSYLVNYIYIEPMGWYLVTMTPQEEIYAPIKQGNIFFYLTLALLLFFAVGAGYVIFRHVQIPVTHMLKVVRRFEKGEYSVRLNIDKEHDFTYLFKSFNRMAATIQELIERVYVEKIQSRDATLKQLQSQINPHFLYNSLYFVESMIHMDNREAASDMVMSLAKYFRYATYTGKQLAELKDELDVVESYLHIHHLRNSRFQYSLEIPEEMLHLEVPRLILQPIIENAIKYGMEAKEGKSSVHVKGYCDHGEWKLIVDDNGPGIDEERRLQLIGAWKLDASDAVENCGMYNVNQRLQLHYGDNSGLEIDQSPQGGCRIVLKLGEANQQRGLVL